MTISQQFKESVEEVKRFQGVLGEMSRIRLQGAKEDSCMYCGVNPTKIQEFNKKLFLSICYNEIERQNINLIALEGCVGDVTDLRMFYLANIKHWTEQREIINNYK